MIQVAHLTLLDDIFEVSFVFIFVFIYYNSLLKLIGPEMAIEDQAGVRICLPAFCHDLLVGQSNVEHFLFFLENDVLPGNIVFPCFLDFVEDLLGKHITLEEAPILDTTLVSFNYPITANLEVEDDVDSQNIEPRIKDFELEQVKGLHVIDEFPIIHFVTRGCGEH